MKNIWWAVISVFVVTGIVVTWVIQSAENPEWKEMQQLQEEIRASMQADAEQTNVDDSAESSPETEAEKERREELRMEKIAEYRDKIESLPEKLQKTARDQMGKMFVSRMQQRIDLVLSLPPDERDEELDKQIDEWDRRIAAWDKRREKENEKSRSGSGSGGGNQEADKKKTGGRRGWASASKEQRDTWRRELLSRTTAEQRAKWHEYRRLMDERRKERGLSTRSFN